jgi:hypothetical protein
MTPAVSGHDASLNTRHVPLLDTVPTDDAPLSGNATPGAPLAMARPALAIPAAPATRASSYRIAFSTDLPPTADEAKELSPS